MFWCLYILLTLNVYSATSVRTAAQEPLHYVIDIFYFLSNTCKYFSWKEVAVQSTSVLTPHDSTWSISCQTMGQWILFLSNTLSLKHLSISSYFPGPWNISTKYTVIFSLYLEPLYLELLSISNKYFGPIATVFSLWRTFTCIFRNSS